MVSGIPGAFGDRSFAKRVAGKRMVLAMIECCVSDEAIGSLVRGFRESIIQFKTDRYLNSKALTDSSRSRDTRLDTYEIPLF